MSTIDPHYGERSSRLLEHCDKRRTEDDGSVQRLNRFLDCLR